MLGLTYYIKIEFLILCILFTIIYIIKLKMFTRTTSGISGEYDKKSKAFIRTSKADWGIDPEQNCVIPEVNDNIPVISAIGTSRDGKSTSLNLYANWLIDKYRNTVRQVEPFSPFTAMQTDDVVTNGIDYYIVPQKCMLIDCQGMQLQDAKYDHFLMLITYLMSNIIILTVRERLDLQILNNCLPVFSFLSEIPPEYKRSNKDKPTLLIRIKDFQNSKQLANDKDYLIKLVNKWLEKSNDQYDQIKEAFANAFNIDIIATKYPTMDDDDEVNIHDPNFLNKNKSFMDYCKKLDELTKGKTAPKILKTNGGLDKLVASLRENKKIDWKKLDLYHQITENELRKYLQEELSNDKNLNDETILLKMDGSSAGTVLCKNRRTLIDSTKTKLYQEKFKDITESIKDEVFKTTFDNFDKIYIEAKNKNELLAENIIKPHFDKFNLIYSQKGFMDCWINKIVDFFTDKKTIFVAELEKIDTDVKNKYMSIINQEEIEITKKQHQIRINNEAQCRKIENIINNYDIEKRTKNAISEHLNNLIKSSNYNEPYANTFETVKIKIFADLAKIYTENDITWFMDNNKNISSGPNKTKWSPIDVFNAVNAVSDFEKYYWNTKKLLFIESGFIKNSPNGLSAKINSKIDFDYVVCGKFKFLVTHHFFKINEIDINLSSKYIQKELDLNICNINVTKNENVNIHTITINRDFCEDETLCIFEHLLESCVAKYISQTFHKYKYSNCKLV